jgi:hypothetical protein
LAKKIDVPVHLFSLSNMSGDSCREVLHGRANVEVIALSEGDATQAANLDALPPGELH